VKVISSQIDINSIHFSSNKVEFLKVLKLFNENLSQVLKGAGESAVQKHKSRNKLLARERIEMLVDPNTPFLELSAFAA